MSMNLPPNTMSPTIYLLNPQQPGQLQTIPPQSQTASVPTVQDWFNTFSQSQWPLPASPLQAQEMPMATNAQPSTDMLLQRLDEQSRQIQQLQAKVDQSGPQMQTVGVTQTNTMTPGNTNFTQKLDKAANVYMGQLAQGKATFPTMLGVAAASLILGGNVITALIAGVIAAFGMQYIAKALASLDR